MKRFIDRLERSLKKRLPDWLTELIWGKDESDDNDMTGIRPLDADISSWPVTTELTAYLSGGSLFLRYDAASRWPHARQKAQDGGPLVGNVWVVIGTDAMTWDWMRPGQQDKARSSVRGTDGHIQHHPYTAWTPVSGERYGFIVSTPARTDERTLNERSNVSYLVWP